MNNSRRHFTDSDKQKFLSELSEIEVRLNVLIEAAPDMGFRDILIHQKQLNQRVFICPIVPIPHEEINRQYHQLYVDE